MLLYLLCDKKTLFLLIFSSRAYAKKLRLTLVDRFHPFLHFRSQIFAAFPLFPPPLSSHKTQKLASRTRRPKKELRSQKKRSNLLFHSSQRTKNFQRLKTKCSRSRLPVARYVHSVPLFFRANVVSKRGFRVRVRVTSGGSVARNFAR